MSKMQVMPPTPEQEASAEYWRKRHHELAERYIEKSGLYVDAMAKAIELQTQVTNLQAEIERLHNQYAHEGGKPQIMTADIAQRWIRAIDVPIMLDIFQTAVTNVFYASFSMMLEPEHKAQIQALGFEVIYPNSSLRNRYMLKWRVPQNDED